jgi:hypothetical protein
VPLSLPISKPTACQTLYPPAPVSHFKLLPGLITSLALPSLGSLHDGCFGNKRLLESVASEMQPSLA